MSKSISRLQFLRGDWTGKIELICPPSNQTKAHFQKNCTGCRACVAACPEKIIVMSRRGFPYLDFNRRESECTFCGECAKVCEADALVEFEAEKPPRTWLWQAQIKDSCLAQQKVICRSCGEVCLQTAIVFHLQVGGVAKPELNTEQCNGCGACLSVCPVDAITLIREKNDNM